MSLVISIWLVSITVMFMRLIRKQLNEDFHKEVSQIICFFWTFIITYTSWVLIDFMFLLNYFDEMTDFFASCITFVVLPVFQSYIPILIVMFIQFKNVISTRRLLNQYNQNVAI